MQISDAIYSLVQAQCQAQHEAVLQKCEAARASLEASIRTDMDQIITSKEHVTNKIRGWLICGSSPWPVRSQIVMCVMCSSEGELPLKY